jgi:hypothetical protein
MNYLEIVSLVREVNIEKLIPEDEVMFKLIEPHEEFEGGKITDVVMSEGSEILYELGEMPPVGDRSKIPFSGQID